MSRRFTLECMLLKKTLHRNPVLPPAVLVNPIQWTLDDQIHLATQTEPAPLGGPEGKPMYLPPNDPPFWAPFMLPQALDTQAAGGLVA